MTVGETELDLIHPMMENLPVDRPITVYFSGEIQAESVSDAISIGSEDQRVNISTILIDNNSAVIIHTQGVLEKNTVYTLKISSLLRSINGSNFTGTEINFKTLLGDLRLSSFIIEEVEELHTRRLVNAPLDFTIMLEFDAATDPISLQEAVQLAGEEVPQLDFTFSEENRQVLIRGLSPLRDLTRYTFTISDRLKGKEDQGFMGFRQSFFTQASPSPKFPILAKEVLLTKVQEQTFQYFWDLAHESSGMARERNTSGNLVTTGGTGFGLMALLVGMERGFISRQQGVERIHKIVDFLAMADRFHGVWPHWINGNTGEVIPFSEKDNGGDLVETALLMQGLLTVKAYLNNGIPLEKSIKDKITKLWQEVNWEWYTREGQDVLYWHWSPEFGWDMDLPIKGYNEALIVYVLAASSPTFPIEKSVYENGWASNGGMLNGDLFFGNSLPLGRDLGGPLFFAHYSYLGLDPRNLEDQYANYWQQNQNHCLINWKYCIQNPQGFVGYGEECWGLTASDNQEGYAAHSPTNDQGVITPTAALSSFPYTPDASLKALEFYYYQMGDRLWGDYGFYDAFNITKGWYADSYLAIDQGPIIIMIENYRSGLLWNTFMKDEDLHIGLDKLGFTY